MTTENLAGFALRPLPHFEYLLTDEDLRMLRTWGPKAQALATGALIPATEKERAFVAFVHGSDPPQSKFERAWLLYCQAARAEEAYELAAVSSAHSQEVDPAELQSDVRRLTIAHSAAWAQVDQLKAELLRVSEAHREEVASFKRRVFDLEQKLGITRPQIEPQPNERDGWGNDWREQP